MPRHIRVRVRELRRGDVLTPTNREIVRVSRGVRTPSGKLDVDLRAAEPAGSDALPVRRATFRADTLVSVIR